MKTLLVTFQKNTDVISLKYIHSYLCKNQIDSHILFIANYTYKDQNTIKKFFIEFRPDVVGISLMSSEFENAKNFSLFIKKEFPKKIIVWGGIHPSANPDKCLNYADYVFIGESEQAYHEFIKVISKNKPVNRIKNLAYKSSGKIIINKLRAPIKDLDKLPFPEHFPKKSYILHKGHILRFKKTLFKKYARYSGRFLSLITTRGCPFSCTYCCNSFFSKLYGKTGTRKRSVENVIKELKLAIRLFPDIIYVNIQDDNFFSHDTLWIKKFAEIYKREIGKKFVCRASPSYFDEEKVSILKKAGLCFVFMGLQSGSSRVNREIYKRCVSNEEFIEAARLVKRYSIVGLYDVILDNPYETKKETIMTIKMLLKMPKPYMLQLFSLCLYPGTELYDRALRENLIIEDPTEKNYGKYKPTFLNKLIKLCPLLPKRVIESFLTHRESKRVRMLINLIYFPCVFILGFFVWFRLILMTFDNNIFNTMDMAHSFFKTGFGALFLRNKA